MNRPTRTMSAVTKMALLPSWLMFLLVVSGCGEISSSSTKKDGSIAMTARRMPELLVVVCKPTNHQGAYREITVAEQAVAQHVREGACLVDDGVDCTIDSCDVQSGCLHRPDDAFCDDRDVCDGTETCHAVAGCQEGTLLDCNDDNPCTDDLCDPLTACFTVDNTNPCDDGDACTTADTCADGECVGGRAPECNDGNLCTDDFCDSATGCMVVDNTNPCDDSDACTTADTCANGECAGGPAPDCNDDNDCTDDFCDSAIGCVAIANDNACDDGDSCTHSDVCSGENCQGTECIFCDDTFVLTCCGDGICDDFGLFGETNQNCPEDCFCGDGVCMFPYFGEDLTSCPEDCYCGDLVCEFLAECSSCPADCGTHPFCP